ncbi:MAG TPA: hypothetical protein VFE72_08855 [Lysobacter sp.]|nr:hypothetical protein [Lysobacter sp.]
MSLTKLVERILVSPAVPARPAIAPIAFRMWGTPLPRGLTYNVSFRGQSVFPSSAADFANWSQVIVAPPEYQHITQGYTFKSLADLGLSGGGGVSIPSNYSPVYEQRQAVPPATGIETVLVGYMVPNVVAVPLPPRYYWAAPFMQFWQFDLGPGQQADNGYPLVAGPIEGYADIPVGDGFQRIRRTFVKDGRGIWIPDRVYPDPPLCITGGAARVLMMSNFPGRPVIPSVAAVYREDVRLGWNTGAVSVTKRDGDVRTEFMPEVEAAGAIGFRPTGAGDVTDYRLLTHAFYFDLAPTGERRARPMESGRLVGTALTYAPGVAKFELRRGGGVVNYLVDGQLVHISAAPSGGELEVGVCLYRAGDGVR